MKRYDLAVLGGGPGGYVAAIRAATTSHASIALIEKELMGGACLNWGCIPTKTLIASSDVVRAVRGAGAYGVDVEGVAVDFKRMSERKDRIVTQIRKSLEQLIASHRITLIRGEGKFISPHELKVIGEDSQQLSADKVIIATGSQPRNIPAFAFDHDRILSSSSILGLTALPRSLVIIGGGVIGCEFASLYQELGCQVTVLEAMETLLPLEGKDIGHALSQALQHRGVAIHTSVRVEAVDVTAHGVAVALADGRRFEADKALVAVGRKLNSEGLGLERIGVATDAHGAIIVNDKMETNIAGVYAIGDVTGKVLLAHVASHQGIVAADNAGGRVATMHYNAIPSVIFTHPEAASVGMTLEKAHASGYSAKVGKFPFHALGKAQASGETQGFAQVVIDEPTKQILGAQVVGHGAAILIAQMGLAIANELTVGCLTDTIHAHPTEAEGWLEAALMTQEMALHLPPKRKP